MVELIKKLGLIAVLMAIMGLILLLILSSDLTGIDVPAIVLDILFWVGAGVVVLGTILGVINFKK